MSLAQLVRILHNIFKVRDSNPSNPDHHKKKNIKYFVCYSIVYKFYLIYNYIGLINKYINK